MPAGLTTCICNCRILLTSTLEFICTEINVWMYVGKQLATFHLLPQSINLTFQKILLKALTWVMSLLIDLHGLNIPSQEETLFQQTV